MTRGGRLVGGAALVLSLMVLDSPLARAASAPAGSTLLGVYYGNQGWAMGDVRAMESWQGKRHAVLNLFSNWDPSTPQTMDNLFAYQLPAIWANGNIPMITWQPYTTGTTPTDIEARIGRGEYDAYVGAWADRMKTWLSGPDRVYGNGDDRRAYVRFAHEMNGNWYPWSAAMGPGQPADYVSMWRRVHDAFTSRGLDRTHLQWVWAPNYLDVGGFSAESFFPGDDSVDWIGIDGYNWGTSQSWSSWTAPAQLFDTIMARLRRISARPFAISEVASSTSTKPSPSVSAKSQWVTSLVDYAVGKGVRMVSWFNTDKETDWAVFGGGAGDTVFNYGSSSYRAYSAYRTAARRTELASSNAGNLRLLTDAQFAGILP